jgi:hypothetical protein
VKNLVHGVLIGLKLVSAIAWPNNKGTHSPAHFRDRKILSQSLLIDCSSMSDRSTYLAHPCSFLTSEPHFSLAVLPWYSSMRTQ